MGVWILHLPCLCLSMESSLVGALGQGHPHKLLFWQVSFSPRGVLGVSMGLKALLQADTGGPARGLPSP